MTSKTATTSAPVHPLIAQRWSPRAFDHDLDLTETELRSVLEAARWAPSASNSQPWRFGVARRGSAEFSALVDALMPGNQPWAKYASVLLLVATETTGPDGGTRPWALYDAGQAAAHLSIQAEALGLSVHQLGGFDQSAAADIFELPRRRTRRRRRARPARRHRASARALRRPRARRPVPASARRALAHERCDGTSYNSSLVCLIAKGSRHASDASQPRCSLRP